jgi:Kyakuja-Dileera-Zisupton transposase
MSIMPTMMMLPGKVQIVPVSAQWHVPGEDFLSLPPQLIFRREKGKCYLLFFVPKVSVMTGTGRQKNIDYAICRALNAKNMRGIKRTLLIYDIMCQWAKWFLERVKESPYLEVPEGLEILKAIGDFHVKGHMKDCLTRFGLAFIDGVGIIDGEVLETLWSVLNESSRSTRAATLAHRAEILDDHMNHSNWKKLVGTGKTHIVLPFLIAEPVFLVTSLVKKWKRARMLYSNAEEAFLNLSATADPNCVARWTEEAEKAKAGRHENVKAMDYFQVAEFPGIKESPYHPVC